MNFYEDAEVDMEVFWDAWWLSSEDVTELVSYWILNFNETSVRI